MADDEPMLWVVAGCLFEVSLPSATVGHWRWVNAGREVTLLGEAVREGRHHLRFRAEAAGAQAGAVQLRFEPDEAGDPEASVSVRIVPERL